MTLQPSLVLIGLGNQGQEHLSACLGPRTPFRLTGVCDSRIDGLLLPALPASCRQFTSVDAFLKSPHFSETTAALVATPPSSYQILLPKLFEAGLDVLVEKPLGLDLGEAAGHLAEARRKGRVLMPAAQRRYHPAYRQVPYALAEMGRIEEAMLSIQIVHRSAGWRKNEGLGSLVDLGFHALDLARDLFGDLRLQGAVLFDAEGLSCHDRCDDSARLLFLTESGTFLRMEIRRGAVEKSERMEAVGNNTHLVVERGRILLRKGETLCIDETFDAEWTEALRNQLVAFRDACVSRAVGGQPSDESSQAGLITMKLIEEVYAHAATC